MQTANPTRNLRPVSPLSLALAMPPSRGDRVTTPGGASGWYVGTLRGCDWVAYELADLAPMIAAFDAAAAKVSA